MSPEPPRPEAILSVAPLTALHWASPIGSWRDGRVRGVIRWVELVVEPALLLVAVHRRRSVVEPKVRVPTYGR